MKHNPTKNSEGGEHTKQAKQVTPALQYAEKQQDALSLLDRHKIMYASGWGGGGGFVIDLYSI